MIALVLAFAALNRARGSRLFGLTESTTISRLVATGLMASTLALACGNPALLAPTWAGLMLWCSSAWDDLWSAAIGHDPGHSCIWGLLHLGLRMTLLAPCLIAVALMAGHPWNAFCVLLTPLLALPYYVYGHCVIQPIAPSEYTAGALLGVLLDLAAGA